MRRRFRRRNVKDVQELLCKIDHAHRIFFVYLNASWVSTIITNPSYNRCPFMNIGGNYGFILQSINLGHKFITCDSTFLNASHLNFPPTHRYRSLPCFD